MRKRTVLNPHPLWAAKYEDGTVEIFYKKSNGDIKGCGPCANESKAMQAHFRCMVLDNRPPLEKGVSQAVRELYEQGYFVCPAAIPNE